MPDGTNHEFLGATFREDHRCSMGSERTVDVISAINMCWKARRMKPRVEDAGAWCWRWPSRCGQQWMSERADIREKMITTEEKKRGDSEIVEIGEDDAMTRG